MKAKAFIFFLLLGAAGAACAEITGLRTPPSAGGGGGLLTLSTMTAGATNFVWSKVDTVQPNGGFWVSTGIISGPFTIFNAPRGGFGAITSSITFSLENNSFGSGHRITLDSTSNKKLTISKTVGGVQEFYWIMGDSAFGTVFEVGDTASKLSINGSAATFAVPLVDTSYDCSGNTNGGKLTADASGNITCSDDSSGGGGGSSSLAVSSNNVVVSSPTSNINFMPPFIVALQGSTSAQVTLDVSSVTMLGPTIEVAEISDIASTYLTQSSATANYLTKSSATANYQLITDAANKYLTQSSATATYLLPSVAAATYLAQSSATATYLALSSASATYLPSAAIANTYLSQSSATATYLTKSSATANYQLITDAASKYLTQSSATATYLLPSVAAATYITQASSTNFMASVYKDGVFVSTRTRLNFITGSNTTLTVADNATPDRVDVTIAATATGGGGASTLAVATGTSAGFSTPSSSPTAVINFDQTMFTAQLKGGATAFVSLSPSSVTLQGVLVAGSNITLTPGTGITTIAATGGGSSNSTHTITVDAAAFSTLETSFAVILTTGDGLTTYSVRVCSNNATVEYLNLPKINLDANLNTNGTVTFRLCGRMDTAAASKNVAFTFDSSNYASGVLPPAYSSYASGDLALTNTQNVIDCFTWTKSVSQMGWAANDVVQSRLSRTDPSTDEFGTDFYLQTFSLAIPTQ